MRFIITERKGCLYYNFYKNNKVKGLYKKANIILTNFNYTCFKMILESGEERFNCIFRFERDLFFDIEKKGIGGYRNIVVTSIKGNKICYNYDSITFIPKEPHKKRPYKKGQESFIFENKKEYVILFFLLDGYVIKKRGLDYLEEKLNFIYNSIKIRIKTMKEPNDFLENL
jgi:hypothetical protein